MLVEPLQLIATTAFKNRKTSFPISTDRIASAEARLGLALPEALKDYYTVAGKHPEMMGQDFHLLSPEALRIEGDYLVFCDENRQTASWGIHRNNLALPNPRVEGKSNDVQKWFSESSKLSAFLLALGSWQALLSQQEIARCELPEKQLGKIEPLFEYIGERSLRLGGHRVGLIDPSRPIIAVYLFNPEMLYVGTPDEAAIQELGERAALDFEWH